MRPFHVWHIDDEDVFRRLFQIFCRRRQLRVVIQPFDDAQTAVDLLRLIDDADTPDLIVLDLRMPGFDGFDFLKSLPTVNPNRQIPVFVLSSSTDVNDIIEAHACGAVSYFSKDEVEDLLERIRSMSGPQVASAAAG